MAFRCTRKRDLAVHHKRRNAGNELSNAEVLCPECHKATNTFGTSGRTPPGFSGQTIQDALERAGFRCECRRIGGCH